MYPSLCSVFYIFLPILIHSFSVNPSSISIILWPVHSFLQPYPSIPLNPLYIMLSLSIHCCQSIVIPIILWPFIHSFSFIHPYLLIPPYTLCCHYPFVVGLSIIYLIILWPVYPFLQLYPSLPFNPLLYIVLSLSIRCQSIHCLFHHPLAVYLFLQLYPSLPFNPS